MFESVAQIFSASFYFLLAAIEGTNTRVPIVRTQIFFLLPQYSLDSK